MALFKKCHDSLEARYQNLRNEIRSYSWFVHATVCTFAIGIVLVGFGLLFVITNGTAPAWGLVGAGVLAILVAIFFVLVKFVIVGKPAPQSRRRRRRLRQQVWASGSSAVVCGERTEPPTYDEARADQPPAYSEHLSTEERRV